MTEEGSLGVGDGRRNLFGALTVWGVLFRVVIGWGHNTESNLRGLWREVLMTSGGSVLETAVIGCLGPRN